MYNSFAISVSDRTKQFGLLASIGATRAQLRRTVYAEAGTVALVGIPLGLLAGCGGMWVTIRLLSPRISGMIGAHEVAMRFAASPLSLLAAALIALATVFLSAQIPARRAMPISPIEAIRQSRDVRAAAKHGGSGRLSYRLLGLLSSRYFHRSRKKYRATIFSLAMSVLLFVSASTYGMYLTESVTESVNLPPYDLSYSTGEGEKDVAMLPALRAADGVEKVWFASYDNGDYVLDRNEFASGYRNILEKSGAGT